MKQKSIVSLCFGLAIYLFSMVVFAADLSPVGTWLTIDDVTKKPRSIVKITEQNGQLSGAVSKVYYQQGEGPRDVCDKCSGSLHNQKILGMTILTGMAKDGDNTWSGGQSTDPKNGKTYKCKITMNPDGQMLNVRGYVGVSMLGRTQSWIRQK